MGRIFIFSLVLNVLCPYSVCARTDIKVSLGEFVKKCGVVLRGLPPLEKADYIWEDGYIPDDFLKTTSISFGEHPKRTTISVISQEKRLRQFELNREMGWFDPSKDQVIIKNTDYENDLIKESLKYGRPLEVARSRAFDRNGRVVAEASVALPGRYPGRFRQIFFGVQGEVPGRTLETLLNAVNVDGAYVTEMTHVHPFYEYLFHHDDWSSAGHADFSLSDQDLFSGRSRSRRTRHFYRERVVVLNGYTYQVTFKDGEQIRDPLLH